MYRLLCGAIVALASTSAWAGMYHSGPTNVCADCHTMHASMAHDFNGASSASATPKTLTAGSWLPNQGNPAASLLKGTETGVCIACHDGQTWAPDVVATKSYEGVRSAGFIPSADGQGGAAVESRGHTMNWTGTVPGGTRVFTGFTCVNCHSPHGRAEAFRNLNPLWLVGIPEYTQFMPRFVISQTPFTSTPSGAVADVRINIASYTAGDFSYYANANVVFEKGSANNLDRYCGGCHDRVHDDSIGAGTSVNQNATGDAAGLFIRHPTNNEIGRPAGPAISPTFTTKVYRTSISLTGYVGCLSCHKAHGTANPFALFYARWSDFWGSNSLDNSESGTGSYIGLCSNCHTQAR